MVAQEVWKVRRAISIPNNPSTVFPNNVTIMFDEQGVPLPWEFLEQLYTHILKSYRPRRLDSRGTLFRSEAPDQQYARAFDDSLGWNNLFAQGLEIVPALR